jgi:hypothetical protein
MRKLGKELLSWKIKICFLKAGNQISGSKEKWQMYCMIMV